MHHITSCSLYRDLVMCVVESLQVKRTATNGEILFKTFLRQIKLFSEFLHATDLEKLRVQKLVLLRLKA